MVIAGSFSETYKRNAFNNGYLVIEIPELIPFLKEQTRSTSKDSTTAPTIKTGLKAEIDFKKSELVVAGKKYPFPVVGTIAQEIILAGGLESWVQQKMV